MTETTEPGGSDAAPEPSAAPDRLPTTGQSITAHRALAAPATVDRAARTVEVVWSTGARARNYVPALGLITEELDMSPNAVRMDGLRSGQAPVLNTHRRGDARDVLGRITAARLPKSVSIVAGLLQTSERYTRLQLSSSRAFAKAAREHRELLAACRACDVRSACDLLAAHIEGVRADLAAVLRRTSGIAASVDRPVAIRKHEQPAPGSRRTPRSRIS
jgi:hypothetical protein